MTTRSRIIGFGSSALLVVAGVVGAVAVAGTVGQLLAFILISLGLVFATALVFYEVGLSEDKERAEVAEAQLEAERRSQRETRPSVTSRRRRPPRMQRMRGRRRRL